MVKKKSPQREVDEMKAEPSYRQGSESDPKLVELRQTHDAYVCALREKPRDRDPSIDGFQ